MMRGSSNRPYHFLLVGGGSVSTIGGVVRFFRDLSANLSKKGYRVTILANGHPGDVPFYDYDPNVRLIFMKYPHSLRKAWQFGRIAELLDPDAVVVKFSNFVGLPAMMGLVDKPFPILRAEHGNPDHILETIWKGDARQRELSFLGADRVHLLSEDYLRRQPLPAFIRERTFIVSSPVTPATLFAQPGGESDAVKRVIYSGRIETYEKNSMLLLDAFLPLRDRFPNWNLEFFGDGGLRPEMEARCRDLDLLGTRVIFHGSVPLEQLVENYATSHLFAFPSDTEGAPIALGEALAHGLPSIGFADCTGTNERILHELNGILVEAPTDYGARASAFSAAMARLMADDGLRRRMGEAAIHSAERYRPDVIFDRWEGELCRLAAQKPYVASRRARERSEPIAEARPLYVLARRQRRKSAVSRKEDRKFLKTIRAQPHASDLAVSKAIGPRWKRLFRRSPKVGATVATEALVSIVIPAFNKGPVLANTVKSALAQDGVSREVLVIDDGSSDDSGKVLDRLEGADDLRIFRRTNQGVGAARNFGLNQARGKYLLFWDADDVLEAGAVAEITKVAERHQADIAVGALYHFKHGKAARWMRPPFWLMREKRAGTASHIRNDILLRYDVSAANKLFRRDFLVENSIYYQESIRLEDILFSWVAHLAAKRVCYSGVTLGGYRKFGRGGLLVTGSASWSEVKLSSVPVVFRALHDLTENEEGDFKPDIDIYFLSVFVAALESIHGSDWPDEKRARILEDYRSCLSEVDPWLISLLPVDDRDLLLGMRQRGLVRPLANQETVGDSGQSSRDLALPRLIRILESYPTRKRVPLDADWEWFARHHIQECLLLPIADRRDTAPPREADVLAPSDRKIAVSGDR